MPEAGTPQTWSTYARKILEELQAYDKEHKTSYAYYLSDTFGVQVLAQAIENANRRLEWQKV